MRQLINGKLYDTQTAEEIIRVKIGSNYASNGFTFYKTKNGSLFKERTYWRCAVDGSTDRLSETNLNELTEICLSYGVPIETIMKVNPDFSFVLA